MKNAREKKLRAENIRVHLRFSPHAKILKNHFLSIKNVIFLRYREFWQKSGTLQRGKKYYMRWSRSADPMAICVHKVPDVAKIPYNLKKNALLMLRRMSF